MAKYDRRTRFMLLVLDSFYVTSFIRVQVNDGFEKKVRYKALETLALVLT